MALIPELFQTFQRLTLELENISELALEKLGCGPKLSKTMKSLKELKVFSRFRDLVNVFANKLFVTHFFSLFQNYLFS